MLILLTEPLGHEGLGNPCWGDLRSFMKDPERLSSMVDACRLAQGMDALIRWRALFEPFEKSQDRLRELVRPLPGRVRPLS